MKKMLMKEYFGDNNGREAKVLLTPKDTKSNLNKMVVRLKEVKQSS